VSRTPYQHLAQQAERLLVIRQDPRAWIEQNLHIRTKDQRVIRLGLNWAQQYYYAHRSRRDVILKARQMGVTTLICALFFADCLRRPHTTSVIVAHDLGSATRIFGIIRLFWERLPEEEKRRVGKPRYSNRREFFWPRMYSHFYVATAGSPTSGRGMTINNVHASEFAFWPKPEEALVALTEAVPKAGGRIIIESTANGVGNYYHDFWTAAKGERNGFEPHFFVWWEDPTNRLPGAPLGDLTQEERGLKQRWGLDDEQIRWRRAARELPGGRFLQEYPEDEVTCFLASGRCCFDTQALVKIQQRIAGLPVRLLHTLPGPEGRPVPVAPCMLSVWEEPVVGHRYAIGADIGEGLEGGDASCACVLDAESGRQVAELHGRVSPEQFARLLDALGRHFNRAMLGVERNNHGHSALNTLRHACRYPRMYYYIRYDAHGKTEPVLGWPTDALTKPILVDDLVAAVAHGHLLISSSALIDECFTFVTTDTGAQQAQAGKHDDRVMAAGIAWQVRKRGQRQGVRVHVDG